MEDPTQVLARRMAKLAAEEGAETETTTDPTENETAEWENTGPETSNMHEGEETAQELPPVEKKRAAPMLKASGVVANSLLDTGIWNRTRGRKNVEALRAVDPRRVNIVSWKLCGKPRQERLLRARVRLTGAAQQTASASISARRSSGTAAAISST